MNPEITKVGETQVGPDDHQPGNEPPGVAADHASDQRTFTRNLRSPGVDRYIHVIAHWLLLSNLVGTLTPVLALSRAYNIAWQDL